MYSLNPGTIAWYIFWGSIVRQWRGRREYYAFYIYNENAEIFNIVSVCVQSLNISMLLSSSFRGYVLKIISMCYFFC